MGRPLMDIDEVRVTELASQGARNSEIAAILGIDEKTVSNRFSRLLDKTRAERRVRLRMLQMEQAEQGNPTMLIWLGKNELDQTDKQTVESKSVVVERRDRAAGKPAPSSRGGVSRGG